MRIKLLWKLLENILKIVSILKFVKFIIELHLLVMADFVENNGVYSSGEGRGFEEDPLEEFFKPSN